MNPLAKVAVANLDILQGFLQDLAQAFGQVDGAVMPARAANGYGHVGPIAGGKARQPFEQVAGDVFKHFFDIRLSGQVFGNRLV